MVIQDSETQERPPLIPGFRAFDKILWWSHLIFISVSLSVGLMSHFRREQSTVAQQVWIVTWLALRISLGPVAALFSAVLEYRGRVRSLSEPKKFLLLIGSLVLAVPAIGGFVVVGQMIRAYRDCISLY